MMEVIAQAFVQVSEGRIPETRDSVADCLVHLAGAAIGEWCEGSTPVGRELDHLARAVMNDEDPTMRDMNLGTRMQLRMALHELSKLKERTQHG